MPTKHIQITHFIHIPTVIRMVEWNIYVLYNGYNNKSSSSNVSSIPSIYICIVKTIQMHSNNMNTIDISYSHKRTHTTDVCKSRAKRKKERDIVWDRDSANEKRLHAFQFNAIFLLI